MRCGGWRIFDLPALESLESLNEKPAEWISGFFIGCGFCVYIRCCGHGCLGFRPDGGSLSKSAKVTKALLPHHSVPRLGSACPHSGIAPWAAAKGHPWPSAANPASMPGCPLRNACVRPSWLTGRPRSTSTARRPNSRPGSLGRTPIRSVGAKLARDGGGSVTWMLGCRPLREQARSHSGSVLGINFVFTGD
jgi:hypothetical protein